MRIATIIALGLALLMGTARDGSACSRARPVPTSQALVREASLIMLVRAMPTRLSNMVEFLVIETIKGESIGSSIVLEGTLVARGDYNDSPFPYTFVRAQGRSGNCFAKTYCAGAFYMLLLKRTSDVAHSALLSSAPAFTPYWEALAPTNEQVQGPDDRWSKWVRRRVQSTR
jgi:hypothetical protein